MTALLRSRDRRVLGERGLDTRARVLAAAAKHVECTPWHLASVPAVTRSIGMSPSTFYQFFADMPDVVRELVAGSGDELPEHLALIAELLDFEEKHLGAVGDD